MPLHPQEGFILFLDYDVEVRKILCSTNAVESFNRRYRRAIRARGHSPTDQAALKCLYLVTRSWTPSGAANRLGDALETRTERFVIIFEGRTLRSNTNQHYRGN